MENLNVRDKGLGGAWGATGQREREEAWRAGWGLGWEGCSG